MEKLLLKLVKEIVTLSSGHHLFCSYTVSKMLFFSGWFQDCLCVLVLEQLDYDVFKWCVYFLWIYCSTKSYRSQVHSSTTDYPYIALYAPHTKLSLFPSSFIPPLPNGFIFIFIFLIYLVQCSLNLLDLLNLSLSKFGEISFIISPDSSCRYIKPFDIPQVLEALFIFPPQIFLCFSDWILPVDLYWNSLSFVNCKLFIEWIFLVQK